MVKILHVKNLAPENLTSEKFSTHTIRWLHTVHSYEIVIENFQLVITDSMVWVFKSWLVSVFRNKQ